MSMSAGIKGQTTSRWKHPHSSQTGPSPGWECSGSRPAPQLLQPVTGETAPSVPRTGRWLLRGTIWENPPEEAASKASLVRHSWFPVFPVTIHLSPTHKNIHTSFHLSRGVTCGWGLNWMNLEVPFTLVSYDCRDLEPSHSPFPSIYPSNIYPFTHSPTYSSFIHSSMQSSIHHTKHVVDGTCLAPYDENTGKPRMDCHLESHWHHTGHFMLWVVVIPKWHTFLLVLTIKLVYKQPHSRIRYCFKEYVSFAWHSRQSVNGQISFKCQPLC